MFISVGPYHDNGPPPRKRSDWVFLIFLESSQVLLAETKWPAEQWVCSVRENDLLQKRNELEQHTKTKDSEREREEEEEEPLILLSNRGVFTPAENPNLPH